MEAASLYERRAELYDRIYSFKDYAAEAIRLRELLTREGAAPGSSLVDACCGTGSHLALLAADYRVGGFDASAAMLAIARRKLPAARLVEADVRDFRWPEQVDALTCLFSSIGYLRSVAEVDDAAKSFARALRPGGVLVIEPWLTREDCKPGIPTIHTYADDDIKLCRMAVTVVEGDFSIFEMNWLVGRRDAAVEHFVERHELRLAPRAELASALERAGFAARFEEEGLMPKRGLFVARRR